MYLGGPGRIVHRKTPDPVSEFGAHENWSLQVKVMKQEFCGGHLSHTKAVEGLDLVYDTSARRLSRHSGKMLRVYMSFAWVLSVSWGRATPTTVSWHSLGTRQHCRFKISGLGFMRQKETTC